MNFLSQLISRSQSEQFSKGVEFEDYNMISIITVTMYIGALIINGTIGVKTAKKTSDSYKLVVTPPSWAFSIWGVIFSSTLIAVLWSIHSVSWSLQTHLYFWLYCITITVWIILWAIVSKITMVLCEIVLLILTFNIYLLWKSTFAINDDSLFVNLMRSAISFQLGWTASAQCLNTCIVLVHVLGFSQKSISKLIWLCILLSHGLYVFLGYTVCSQQQNNFIFNFGTYFLSMSWAILGVFISYQIYINDGKTKDQ